MTFNNDIDNIKELEKLSILFPSINSLTVQKQLLSDVKKILSVKKNYTLINKDKTKALDKTLYLLSNLTSTIFSDSEDKFKALNRSILHEQTKNGKDNTFVYKKIINLLKSKGVLEVLTVNGRETYLEGSRAKQYKLSDKYFNTKTKVYTIKDKDILNRRNKLFYTSLSKAYQNPIAKVLLRTYGVIELPSEEDIYDELKTLAKEGYYSKKGKKLTFLNGHAKTRWKDSKNRTFAEDLIILFNYLTKQGYAVPIIGSKRSGGRVVDSFSLMPSVIRQMSTIDGERLIEVDYGSLHSNIASAIYEGTGENINHTKVAEYLGVSRQVAKIENLSFFNKKVQDMKRSPLFKYYTDNEPIMLENILKDKKENGYKITSQKLFDIEVKIMTEVFKDIEENQLNALYIYDAVMIEEKDVKLITEIMNNKAELFNVNTTV